MKLTNDPPVVAACRNMLGALGVDHDAMTDEEVLEATERALAQVRALGVALGGVIRDVGAALATIAANLHAAADVGANRDTA